MGQIHQYVGLNDTAWAVGNWEWNKRPVSIEHVGTTANLPSYATLVTSAHLMAALARSKGWRHLTMGGLSEFTDGIHRLAVLPERMLIGLLRRQISFWVIDFLDA